MKKILLFCILILSYSSAFTQTNNKFNIIGSWKGIDQTNQIGYMKFIDSSHVIINIPGMEELKSTYTLDLNKEPALIDIFINIDNFSKKLPGFLMIVDANTFKWQTFFNSERPEVPVEENADNTVAFRRVNE